MSLLALGFQQGLQASLRKLPLSEICRVSPLPVHDEAAACLPRFAVLRSRLSDMLRESQLRNSLHYLMLRNDLHGLLTDHHMLENQPSSDATHALCPHLGLFLDIIPEIVFRELCRPQVTDSWFGSNQNGRSETRDALPPRPKISQTRLPLRAATPPPPIPGIANFKDFVKVFHSLRARSWRE